VGAVRAGQGVVRHPTIVRLDTSHRAEVGREEEEGQM
jgi:hypothetical protein